MKLIHFSYLKIPSSLSKILGDEEHYFDRLSCIITLRTNYILGGFTLEFKEEAQRIVIFDEGNEIGEITWIFDDAGDLVVEHTRVDGTYRGQGLAGKLVEKVAEYARREEKKIVPVCSYAKKEFERKSDYADVWKK